MIMKSIVTFKLVVICIFSLIGLFVANLGHSKSITVSDFGRKSQRIGFDEFVKGTSLTFQLTIQGVKIHALDGSEVVVVDAGDIDGVQPRSKPNALAMTSIATPLEFVFISTRQKVGMHVGRLQDASAVVLTAYDEQGVQIESVRVDAPSGGSNDIDIFIGLDAQKPVIYRAILDYTISSGPIVIDDLYFEPSQEKSVSIKQFQKILDSDQAKLEEKLEAVHQLQRHPAIATRDILLSLVKSDAHPYLRERALMALVQLYDPTVIPILVELAQKSKEQHLKMAAYNAVWFLRQNFPLADSPEIILKTNGIMQVGKDFEVQASILSPVDRDNVQVSFRPGKLLTENKKLSITQYKGPLKAHQPIQLKERYSAPREGQTVLWVQVMVNLNRVDAPTFRKPLYIEIRNDGGAAGTESFTGLKEPAEHLLKITRGQEQ